MSAQRILVSILHYNNYQDTVETIQCFQQQTCSGIELLVIDNASTNRTCEQIIQQFPTVRIIRTAENLGYAGGNNIALEIGLKENYDYVVVSNDDIYIEPNVIAKLIETASQKESVGIVGVLEEDF